MGFALNRRCTADDPYQEFPSGRVFFWTRGKPRGFLFAPGRRKFPSRYTLAPRFSDTAIRDPHGTANQVDGASMRVVASSLSAFLSPYLAIGLAGGVGAISRYVISSICGRIFGNVFPVGTFVINMTASVMLGWFLAAIR